MMRAELRRKILVVEDEEKLARLLEQELTSAGYDVHVELRGQAALQHAAERQPDLVILDLRLPDLSGYQVCKELRRLYSSWAVPVLMLTAMDMPIDQLRGFATGADAYMVKPFEFQDLLETVALLLGHGAPA